MSESRVLRTELSIPSRIWLGILFFLDFGWMYFDRAAYHPGNMTIDYQFILDGKGCAPEQFRIAILTFASYVQRHSHLSLQEVVNGLDLTSACFVSVVLLRLLQRNISRNRLAGFQVSPSLAAALLALLSVVNLHWTYYFVRPETLPGTLFVCLSTLLVGNLATSRKTGASIAFVAALIVLAVVQSFCRVDLSLSFAAGETLLALFFLPAEAKPRRAAILIAGLTSGVIAALIQLYLMKIRYPNAHYCGDVYTLRHNIMPFALVVGSLFLAPIFAGGVALWKDYQGLDSSGRVLLLAACVHLPMYFCVGNVTETRIFVPYALSLSPWIAVLGAKLLADQGTALDSSRA